MAGMPDSSTTLRSNTSVSGLLSMMRTKDFGSCMGSQGEAANRARYVCGFRQVYAPHRRISVTTKWDAPTVRLASAAASWERINLT